MSAAEQEPLAPCAIQIQGWFDFWFHHSLRGEIQVGWFRGWSSGLTEFKTFSIGDETIGEFVAEQNAISGQSCYFRASTVREGLGSKAAEDADFVEAPGAWGDIDDAGGKERASKVNTLIRPSAWVETGRHPHWRAQPFWRFDTPCSDPARIIGLNKRIIALYQSDEHVFNPTRLMRIPGTIAWPRKAGRIAEKTQVHVPQRPSAYTIEFLEANFPREEAKREAPGTGPASDGPDFGGATRVIDLLRRLREPGQWHSSALRLIAHWVGRGFSDAEIFAYAEHMTTAGFQVAQTRRELAKMLDSARAKWGVGNTDHVVGEKEGPAEPFAGAIFDPWDALAPVAFPMDALPPALAAFSASRATAIGCDPAAVAMACLSALSAALDGRSRLKMKRFDSWSVPPALWVALIGPSSAKKSPAIKAAWGPLEKRQGATLRAYQQAIKMWEAAPKDMKPEKPFPPARYVTHDGTMEAIQGILGNQDRGLGVLRDELAGFIGQMDKYSNGRGGAADRAFFLQAFEGGSYVADRVGRGTVPIENLLLAICGGIQQDRLASFGDLTDDGLWQRFLPVVMAPPSMGQDKPGGEAETAYDGIVEHVLGLPSLLAHLLPDAMAERERMERKLFDLEQSDMLGGAFTSFLGKLNGIWGRLALVLHAADQQAIPGEVSGAHAQGASAVVDYLIKSGARVYLAMGAPGSGKGPQPIKEIAGYILVKKSQRLLASDLTRNVRLCRGLSLEDIQKALSPLVAGNWLNPEKPFPNNNAWTVNPEVHEQFAPRAVSEAARRQRLREETIDRRKGGTDEDE